MKKNIYVLLLILFAAIQTQAQITFKLKSVVGQQNPSSNGLFSYGTLNNGTFQLFPYYGEDGTGVGINVSQKGWTFNLGQESYPFLAFEQLNAAEITPQPFPPFGIFMHPSQDLPSVVKLSIPNNATIISIINKVQRPSFGCGESIGYSIVSDNSTILPRTIVSTSASPNTYMVGSTFINAGNNIYFVVDKGEDGNSWCDDTAIDVEITLLYEKIVTPKLTGNLNCSTTSATFDIAFQQSGTLSLYKSGNATPIATTIISQVGNTFNGQGTFTGLDLSTGGSYYAIASNAGQTSSAPSETISFIPCCVDAVAPTISVNNATICSGETTTLTASNCTGSISWNNGSTGSSIVVSTEGTYTATCTVKGTAPCADGISTAFGTVRVNPLPLLNVGNVYCSADLLTYSIGFTSNSTVTSTLGVVSGNTVSGIQIGKNTILVATTSNGCTISQNVVSPTCNCPMLEAPISEGDKTICSGATILSLSVKVGSNETVDWYDAPMGGNLLLANSTIFTPTTANTFYASARNIVNNCVSSTRTAVMLTINPLPTLVINDTNCSPNLLTYSVNFTSNSIVTSTLGVVSGNTVSGIPIDKNIILVATTSNGCTISQNVVSPTCNCPMLEAPISEGDKTICSGATIPSLSVKVGSNETVDWYDAQMGGNLLLANSTTFTPTTANTFYASARNITNNCVSSTRTAVMLTINPIPTLVINDTNCSPNLLTYSVNFTSNSTVTSTLGVVSGNTVSGIPIGKNTILMATTSNGCTISQNIVSPTCNCPMLEAPISEGDKTICSGATIPSLSVKVGNNETVDWYDAATGGNLLLANSTTFTPTTSQYPLGQYPLGSTFYALARNSVNNCVSSTRTAVTLTINPLPTLVINDTNCSPNLLTYSVSFTSNSPITSTLGVVSGNIVSGIQIGKNTILVATTSNGCTILQNVVSPICNCPMLEAPISEGDKTICSGATIPSLSVKVGSNETVDWYDAPTGGNLLLANSLTFTAKNAGTFYASARNIINNCESTHRTPVTLTINAIGAIPVIIASKTNIILGESSILSINNCNGTVLWNTGESTMSITVLPIKTTIYSATCTANSVCVGGTGSIEIIVEAPKITANASPSTVCVNGSTVLSMTGCPTNAIYWIAKLDGGRLDIASPTINNILQSQSFTGHCITTAGKATADINITVREAQNFQIEANSTQITFGETAQLSSNACDGILTWNTGQVGNVITVKPDKTTTYSAVCNGATSCGGSGQITITVKPPKVEILGGNVCFGQTTTLSQKGCNYAFGWVMWKKDDFSDAISLESPAIFLTERTHIRFTCATPAGDAIEEKVIEPIPLPNKPEMVTDKSSYILGETVEVNALNCNGYLKWSNGEEGKVQIRVKPDRTTTYTAICEGGLGCSAENSIEVIVKTDSPKVKDLTLCYGDTLTLKSACATSTKAHWTEDWFDLPNRIERVDGEKIKLFATKTYAVSCEGSAGYSDAIVIKATVKSQVQKPLIEAEKSIIVKGDSLELFANGCNETEWMTDNSLQIPTKTNIVIVKPNTTTIFSARCKVDGCYSDDSSLKVLVRPKQPNVKASFDTLCVGNSTTITAQNCEDGGILKWLNSNKCTISFDVSPQNDTTYQAVCIGLDNAERPPLISDTTVVKIKVYPTPKPPTISASSTTIIEDERTTLTATNCEGIITWNTGATTRTLTVNPTRNTTYSATCTVWRCVSEKAEISIKVRLKQLEITDGKETGFTLNDTLCLQKQLILSVVTSCNGTIVWNNGQSGRSITIVGTKNEVYEVYCQNADNEKSDISTAKILAKDYNITDAYIYPNPTSGKLFIQSKGCIDGVMLRLFTLRGELIYEGGGQERYLDSLVLDLFNLPSEEYVLHIIGTDGIKPVTLRKRVIKTNK